METPLGYVPYLTTLPRQYLPPPFRSVFPLPKGTFYKEVFPPDERFCVLKNTLLQRGRSGK